MLVTASYGAGSYLLRDAKAADGAWTVEPVWNSIRLQTKFSTAVVRGGHAYGLDEGRPT